MMLWRLAQQRARRGMTPFTITPDDVRAAWPHDGKCPILGLDLKRGRGYTHDATPTLDRINPAWGYEPGNIAIISMMANRAKSNLRATDLEKIAAWMRSRGLD